jgi:general stress protein YciG
MGERSDREPGSTGDARRGDGAESRSGGNSGSGSSRGGNGKSNRGFASMSPERQREIASKGGRAAHEKGTAHEWTADEARAAGRKGGETVSRDRAHMAAIGREGGGARGARKRLTPMSNEAISSSPEARGGNSGAGRDRDQRDRDGGASGGSRSGGGNMS